MPTVLVSVKLACADVNPYLNLHKLKSQTYPAGVRVQTVYIYSLARAAAPNLSDTNDTPSVAANQRSLINQPRHLISSNPISHPLCLGILLILTDGVSTVESGKIL